MPNHSGNGNRFTIAVDTWPLLKLFRNTGIYVYARNLLSHFQEMAGHDSVRVRPLIWRGPVNDATQFAVRTGFEPHQSTIVPSGIMWRYGGSCLSARASKADILFCPSPTVTAVAGLLPVVVTIHDVIPVLFPEHPRARSLRFEFANAARFSRAVITVSQHSKEDLINRFNLPASKVHVTYLACDQSVFSAEPSGPEMRSRLFSQLGIQRPYILHHGRIEQRKNVKSLVEAYDVVVSRNPNLEFDLVLVGELAWRHEEALAAVKAVRPPGRVILAGMLPDADLAVLLKNASLVVIPSLYEGFCLPLLEAMTCGAPVICSRASCLPEVSGGVLRYFDPYSVEDMASLVEQTLDDSALRKELAQKGRERASTFSWRRCAEETLAVLKSAA